MKKTRHDFLQSIKEEWSYLSSIRLEKSAVLIIAIFLLSVLDAVFTLLWIKTGLAIEANPLLSDLIEKGSFSFVSTKIALTAFGCGILYHVRHQGKLASRVITFLACLYFSVLLYHIFGALTSIDSDYVPDWISDFLVWLS